MIEALNQTTTKSHADEVTHGERFEFGKNWSRFLRFLNESDIVKAEESFKSMIGLEHLEGLRFLDIGSGSGLSSLVARRLGARVHSFDYDPYSVASTSELKRRYFNGDAQWSIEEASVLDAAYLAGLPKFDVVYSWGVLHHTGNMWKALGNICELVADGGYLFIALYNDLGTQSIRWRWIKRKYNELPRALRIPFALAVAAPGEAKSLLRSILTLQPLSYIRSWTQYNQMRGMSRWHDIIDWVGGYPYEVASPEAVFHFCQPRGFLLKNLKCGGVGLGCNEFVFTKGHHFDKGLSNELWS